ncbi:MAG: hypothetical protein M1541_10970 [Acidobacteria bacterium]|nr:hypothetical protein [Acidobacteriota bacterium]
MQPGTLAMKRIEFLQRLATIPAFGGVLYAGLRKQGWESHEAKVLAARFDAVAGAPSNAPPPPDPKRQIPRARIGKQEFSRVMLGGNLLGGWAHARDLIYANNLVKAYHTSEKFFETLAIAEKCGFNCQFLDITGVSWQMEYHKRNAGKFKFIIQANNNANREPQEYLDVVKQAIDTGASGFYMQGIESFLSRKQYDLIARALELGRRNGVPVGFGSHRLAGFKEVLAHDLVPDFWMKTLHQHNYWSANPSLKPKDNTFCENPEEVLSFMKEIKQPWIAFKTLAAGAIHPKDGIRYAFASGADFACVGMFDFQVMENASIICDILGGDLKRDRPWRA